MDKKVYARGLAGQIWYNSTEALAFVLLHRSTPKELKYNSKVHYATGKSQYINIYYPKLLEKKKKPLFIYVHGGGWISGIPEMRNTYISAWARLGFLTASLSYTTAPQKEYPYQLKEIFNAIDFLFDNAEKYCIDTDNIVLAGESAGGYFISYIAAVASDSSLLDKLGIEFRHRDEFSVKAMITHSGCFDLERLMNGDKLQSRFTDIKMMVSTFVGKSRKEAVRWLQTENGKLASPHVSENFPPVFVCWTTRDWLRYESFDFMKELEQFGIPYKQFKGDGIIGNHAWTIVTMFKKGGKCFDEAKKFVAEYLPEYF